MFWKANCASVLLLVALATQAQNPAAKVFHDAQYGVTFHYPARWSAGPDVGFYLGSEIVEQNPDGGTHDPIAKVGFVVREGDSKYSGTNLNGVQFVYNVVPQSKAGSCRKRVQDLSEDLVGQTAIHGVPYNHFSGGDAGLGHQASREIYSTFQNGQCYLFEEAIHTASMNEVRPLKPTELKVLQRELDGVMQSVRIEGAR